MPLGQQLYTMFLLVFLFWGFGFGGPGGGFGGSPVGSPSLVKPLLRLPRESRQNHHQDHQNQK